MSNGLALCIPTLNAGPRWREAVDAIKRQTLPCHVLVIDSGSQDGTEDRAEAAGFEVVRITTAEFDHGGTRQWAAEHLSGHKLIVFMTQDAVLSSHDALERLLEPFADLSIGAVFGRQLPHQEAGPIEEHARYFNYPPTSRTTSLDDAPTWGIKSAFLSNVFAAYRQSALSEAGGFSAHTILSEDMLVGARMLQQGWKIAYQADACVYHSHDYSLLEEFRRYFDIGVFHSREAWLIDQFGTPEGEGWRFILSELTFLARKAPERIPEALLRTAMKYTGYRLGRLERQLPMSLKRVLSMHKQYWERDSLRHAS